MSSDKRYKFYDQHDDVRQLIVIVPGLDGATSFFDNVIPELTATDGVAVLMFYLPLKTNAIKDSDYTFDYLASELKSVIDEVNTTVVERRPTPTSSLRITLVGESFGGVVAQVFAHSYPSSLSSLVLLSSLAKTNLPPEIEWKVRNLLPILKTVGWFVPQIAQSIFARLHVDDVCEKHEPQFVKDLFIKEASAAHHYSVMARINIVHKLDIREQSARITTPTLIIYGADDHFTKEASLQLHKIIPQSIIKVSCFWTIMTQMYTHIAVQ
jgi:pimeloyl-ACP methyl ester carboxylesterase